MDEIGRFATPVISEHDNMTVDKTPSIVCDKFRTTFLQIYLWPVTQEGIDQSGDILVWDRVWEEGGDIGDADENCCK